MLLFDFAKRSEMFTFTHGTAFAVSASRPAWLPFLKALNLEGNRVLSFN